MNSGHGGYYVPPNVWATMDQNQRTMLLRHQDESHQQENNHSNTTSTISDVSSPMTQPATSTLNPPQTNPGSLIPKMLSNAYTTASTNNHSSVTEVCQLLEVSWQMCHAWITHWTVVRATLTMSRRRSSRDERMRGRNAREPLLART